MLCWHLKQISCMNLISPYDWLKPNWEVIFVISYFPSWMSFLDYGISIGLFRQKRENEKSYQCGTALYQSHLVVQTCSENFCFFFVLFELAGIIEKGGITVRKHRVYHAGDLYHLWILRPKFFCIFMWRLDIKIRKHRSLDHIFFFQNCPLTVYYYSSFPRVPKCEVEHAYSRNTD